MTTPILVLLDNSLDAPQPALEKALTLARATGRPLHLAVNSYCSAMVRAVGFDKTRQQAARQQIQHAWQQRIEQLLADDHVAHLDIQWEKNALYATRQAVLAARPWLTVVHTSASRGLARHMFTPRDWQLIRKAPCSVLCVNDTPWPSSPALFAALDPGAPDSLERTLSVHVLRESRALSAQLDGRLQCGHVAPTAEESVLLMFGEAIPNHPNDQAQSQATWRQQLVDVCADQGIADADCVSLCGPVAASLVAECERKHITLLTLGTTHKNMAERILLGATAESVLTQASFDVLVIKPHDFASPWEATTND